MLRQNEWLADSQTNFPNMLNSVSYFKKIVKFF